MTTICHNCSLHYYYLVGIVHPCCSYNFQCRCWCRCVVTAPTPYILCKVRYPAIQERQGWVNRTEIEEFGAFKQAAPAKLLLAASYKLCSLSRFYIFLCPTAPFFDKPRSWGWSIGSCIIFKTLPPSEPHTRYVAPRYQNLCDGSGLVRMFTCFRIFFYFLLSSFILLIKVCKTSDPPLLILLPAATINLCSTDIKHINSLSIPR